jgi:AbrB family looped-hinge helix DNA binding protein
MKLQGPDGRYLYGIVKVGPKGQIVIPKDARDHGINPGDRLVVGGERTASRYYEQKPECHDERLHGRGGGRMNAIEIRALTKRFKKSTAVDSLDLTVKEGELFFSAGRKRGGQDHDDPDALLSAAGPLPATRWYWEAYCL